MRRGDALPQGDGHLLDVGELLNDLLRHIRIGLHREMAGLHVGIRRMNAQHIGGIFFIGNEHIYERQNAAHGFFRERLAGNAGFPIPQFFAEVQVARHREAAILRLLNRILHCARGGLRKSGCDARNVQPLGVGERGIPIIFRGMSEAHRGMRSIIDHIARPLVRPVLKKVEAEAPLLGADN